MQEKIRSITLPEATMAFGYGTGLATLITPILHESVPVTKEFATQFTTSFFVELITNGRSASLYLQTLSSKEWNRVRKVLIEGGAEGMSYVSDEFTCTISK